MSPYRHPSSERFYRLLDKTLRTLSEACLIGAGVGLLVLVVRSLFF